MRLSSYICVLMLLALALGSCKSSEMATGGKSKTKLSEKQQRELTAEFYDGVREKQLANFQDALKHFEKCLEIDPNHAASLYEMASIYFHMEKKSQAFELINKAVKIEPKNEYYRLLMADLYSEGGEHLKAAEVYEKLLKDYPSKIEYYYEWASALLYAEKYEEAVKVYNKVEEIVGVSEEMTIQKQRIYLSIKEFDKAIAEIQKLIDAYPEVPSYYGLMAEMYSAKGDEAKAAEYYEKMQKLSPNDPMLHLSMAENYRQKGENDKAFEEMKLAFKSEELDIDAKIQIMLSYYMATEGRDKNLKEEAYELLEILTEVHDDDAKSFAMQADFLFRDNKLAEAKESFKKSIELDQSRFLVWNQLLLVESDLRQFEDLVKDSEKALELFPNQASLYLLNGVGKMQLKQYEDAAEILQSGLIFARDVYLKAQMLSTLGDIYNTTKEYEKSDEAFEKALKINADDPLVLNNYAYYLSERKEKLERAAEMSRKSLQIEPESASYQDTYGWILYQQADYEEAKKWLLKAINNINEQSGVILEHYGDVLYQLGKSSEAVEYWNKAKEMGGGSDLLDKKISDKKLYE